MYAMYLRKSRADDKDIPLEKVLKNHYNMLTELADKLKIQIEEENVFREIETGDSISIRPKMQDLLEKVSEGLYEGVFCTELSRLCRGSKIDQEIVSSTFTAAECKIITPSKTYDLANNEFDEEMVDFGLFMSRREYKTITKRMQRGREQSVKQGKYIGSILPYGYNKEKLEGENGFRLVINEEEAHIVRLIFKWFLEGNVGASIIAKRLNQGGYPTRKGQVWSYSSVKNILTSNVVAGYLKHGERKYKKYIDTKGNVKKSRPVNAAVEYYKGLHEAIIPLHEFEKVQDILNSRKQHKSNFDLPLSNPLAGLIKCSECNRIMVKRPCPQGNFLYCSTTGCKNIGSYLNRVEEHILQALSNTLSDYEYYVDNYEQETIKEKRNVDNDLKRIEKEIEKLNKQFEKCCTFLEQDVYTIEVFKDRTSKIKDKIRILEENKKVLEKEFGSDKVIKIKKLIPKLENVLKNYNTLSIEGKNELLKSIIKEITYTKKKKSKKGSNEDYFELEITLNI